MKAYSFDESKRLWAEAQELIAGGSQGTRCPEYPDFPTYFERAKGCRMWDVDGNEYIDLLCSIGPIVLGYAYDPVEQLVDEIKRSSFQSSMNHPIQLELARLLIENIPCAERVRFLKTGTEATQAAVRLARYITGRLWVARHGYHGWADMFWHNKTEGIHTAAWEVVPWFDGTAEGLRRLFDESGQQFAAVMLCPADTRPFTTENYNRIVEVAHEHGALAIFDEIKSGFRTALGGAQELLRVTPDITVVSKAIANGYPLSAVVGKAEYMERMPETPTAGTFSVEALSIAAAVATIRELRDRGAVAHMWTMGQRLIDGLNTILKAHGMDQARAYADPVPSMPRFQWREGSIERGGQSLKDEDFHYFFSLCFKYGLYFSSWHVGFMNYSHKEGDVDEALDICDFAMQKTRAKFP